jgi:hypothetical protein
MAIDDQLASLLAQNADLFASYEDWSNAQVMLLAGSINDPASFNAQGGTTGALGYYPVVNVSGQTIYVPCMDRLRHAAIDGVSDALEAVSIVGDGLLRSTGSINEELRLDVVAASPAETIAGTRADVAVTPVGVKASTDAVRTDALASTSALAMLTANGLAEKARSADLAAPAGATAIGVAGGGNVADRIQWVTPESFEVPGYVPGTDANRDTAAVQAAVNSGQIVIGRPGATYLVNAEIMPPVGADLVIRGYRKTGPLRTTFQAAPGFVGYMFRPRTTYDIRDLRLSGNSLDGCYGIGSNDAASSNSACINNVNVSSFDIGIYFGDNWLHPSGVQYSQINGVNFRTGAINLGGMTASANGESAWSIDLINVRGSSGTDASGRPGILAPAQVLTANSPDATHDKIDWDNTFTPLYGWCVMRSADGATGWHVPPNWSSPGLNAATFSALKMAGETWQYKVVRMTRGVHIRRGKAISVGVLQSEYFGIGLYYDGFSIAVSQYYGETRDTSPPLPMFCGIYAKTGNISITGGWAEQFGYAIITASNSVVTLSGYFRANNCRWGKGANGGSTNQVFGNAGSANFLALGSTPDTIVALSGSIYEHAAYGVDNNAGTLTQFVDGANGSGYSVRNRGVEKGKLYANPAGEAQLDIARIALTQPSSTLSVPLKNVAYRTNITPGAATAFATISGLGNNGFAGVDFQYAIRVYDGSSVSRQMIAGRITVAMLDATGGVEVAAIIASTPAKAIQAGTVSADPVFAVSVVGGVATLTCNVTTSYPSARIYLVPIGAAGDVAALSGTIL